MKKILLLLALLSIICFANGQSANYRNFKFDIALGYAIPAYNNGVNNVNNGVSITLEPHYRLSDKLVLGFRFEGALLDYTSPAYREQSVLIIPSYCFTGNYYFSNRSIRPFVGAGAGIFSQSASNIINLFPQPGDPTSSPAKTGFGVFPTIGIEGYHLRLSGEYNFIGNNASYFSFNLGFYFGGGRR